MNIKLRFPDICRIHPHCQVAFLSRRGKNFCTIVAIQNSTWQFRNLRCGENGGGENGKSLNVLTTNAFESILMAVYTTRFKSDDEMNMDIIRQIIPMQNKTLPTDRTIASNCMPQMKLSLDHPSLIRQ